MNKISNVLWGVLFISIGFVLGLNALDITNMNLLFDGWWTLFIIIPCFIGLFNEKEKTGNFIGLFIGISLFLTARDIINFDVIWKLFVPAVLVITGLSFIFKDTLNTSIKKEIKKLNKSNNNEYYATFGSQNLNFANEDFDGCKLNAIFGEIKCDLKDANINDDIVIEAISVFGGITIFVPSDVNVKITSTPVFGGVSDERRKINKDSKNTIYIKATCIFGGVQVK